MTYLLCQPANMEGEYFSRNPLFSTGNLTENRTLLSIYSYIFFVVVILWSNYLLLTKDLKLDSIIYSKDSFSLLGYMLCDSPTWLIFSISI